MDSPVNTWNFTTMPRQLIVDEVDRSFVGLPSNLPYATNMTSPSSTTPILSNSNSQFPVFRGPSPSPSHSSSLTMGTNYSGPASCICGSPLHIDFLHFAIPHPNVDPSHSFPLMIPPPSATESSQLIFTSHATNQPYLIPLQSHPSSPLHLSCRWVNDDILCEFTGTLEELRAHCQSDHFSGQKDAKIGCQWDGCNYRKRGNRTVHVMRRDCMWRHTREAHLRLKRGT
ncbi:uncharacterized protein EDB91DRAFT_1153224 [Suillus paluster]|uniref:uncharacterized protein n=1 Tax=Suillus paluster TaxID=48578 RepID=UPI001B874BBB|nr:uncharacterized protein EDB91DRAFT_1153224 [Suillus paluster]KAG1731827.1 hypothetical protein EDB91DRAFT_1153224 [Suillus paluster]